MKKILAPILAVLIVLIFCLPGIAADNKTVWSQAVIGSQAVVSSGEHGQPIISEEKARENLAGMFPEIIAGQDLQAEYNDQSYMSKPCWNFRSRDIMQQPGPRGFEIDALVDAATGEVVRMNYNPDPDLYRGKNVRLTREQALAIAHNYLEKVHPNKVSQLFLSNNDPRYPYYGNDINMVYMFLWSRLANGVIVDADNIYIGVDAITGKVTHYSYNWHNVQFPQADKSISKQELTAKLLNESGLFPAYVSVMGATGNDTSTFIPAYVLNSSAAYYDCHTGQGLMSDGSKIAPEDMRIYEQVFIPQPDGNINKTELTPRKKINPEAAKKAAEDFFKFMGIKGEVIRSGGGSSSGDGFRQEYWTYSIGSEDKYQNMDNNIQVGIDVYTGQIAQFHRYNNPAGDSDKKISYQEAQNKAIAIIKQINPDKKDRLALHKQEWAGKDNEIYSFNFVRLVNGIPCEREGIRVEIDNSGQLRSYWSNWYDIAYTPLTNMISPEKARKIYEEQEPFQLAYVFPMQNLQAPGQGMSTQPRLVYRSQEKSRVDGVSGKMLGWSVEGQSPAAAASWTSHWAAPALSLLNENGLLPAKGINPDEQMSRIQVLKILVRATGNQYYRHIDDQEIALAFTDISESPDGKVLQQAIKKGIIPNQGNFHPNQIMSREDFAVWLVNSLGYQEVAAIKNHIDTSFGDADQISPDKANYVGIAEGLGLLRADENKYFHPQDAITWAEIANAVTRLAVRAPARY
ncbi:MAG: S-layer homology domain-containing protein [Syntrophomonas sp.]|nr:S-layer homology domain-containing protein [Syntrophomonas sp.]